MGFLEEEEEDQGTWVQPEYLRSAQKQLLRTQVP
jgi:hypothetical protein